MYPDPLAWAADGYCVVRSLVTPGHVRGLLGLMDRLDAGGAPRSARILYTHSPAPPDQPGLDRLMDQWMGALGHHEAGAVHSLLMSMGEAVATALGTAVVPFQDFLLRKTDRHEPFRWHQDRAFWPIVAEAGAVCWLALDAVDQSNGGVEVAPGSHLGPKGASIDLHTGLAQPGSPGAAWQPPAGIVPRLEAGDALLFHSACWHRSGRNATQRPRRALAVSWVSSDARWCREAAPRHPILSQTQEGQEVSAWSLGRYPYVRA
ncbi:MAG: hypothetical protein AMXMBFR64_61020 [Myxococcales bacterium]